MQLQLTNSPARYGAIPQVVHWLTALCVVAAWLLGQFMDDFPRGPWRVFALWSHMTLGELVFVLLVARVIWRFANPPPPFEPTRYGRLLEFVSRAGHYAMYALLVAVPLAGIMVQLRRGNALPILGVWNLASPWPADRAVARNILGIHEILANALLILAGLHAAAALIHHYGFRDRTLVRMLPGAR